MGTEQSKPDVSLGSAVEVVEVPLPAGYVLACEREPEFDRVNLINESARALSEILQQAVKEATSEGLNKTHVFRIRRDDPMVDYFVKLYISFAQRNRIELYQLIKLDDDPRSTSTPSKVVDKKSPYSPYKDDRFEHLVNSEHPIVKPSKDLDYEFVFKW